MSDGRMTIRFGPLRDDVARAAAKEGLPDAEWVRVVVARALGRKPPDMPHGRKDFGVESAKGVRARWGTRK